MGIIVHNSWTQQAGIATSVEIEPKFKERVEWVPLLNANSALLIPLSISVTSVHVCIYFVFDLSIL